MPTVPALLTDLMPQNQRQIRTPFAQHAQGAKGQNKGRAPKPGQKGPAPNKPDAPAFEDKEYVYPADQGAF